jgi:ethanolamine utilization protein EutQ (cupin superfamily)
VTSGDNAPLRRPAASGQWLESVQGRGYVLEGALSISFDGDVISFEAGDGLFIPSGAASKHRAVAISAGTKLLMIEDA